jgi:hypothetical protein
VPPAAGAQVGLGHAALAQQRGGLGSSASASSCSSSIRRSRISCAALRVKVMASSSGAWAPASNRRSMRATSSQVLPLPAQASTTTE